MPPTRLGPRLPLPDRCGKIEGFDAIGRDVPTGAGPSGCRRPSRPTPTVVRPPGSRTRPGPRQRPADRDPPPLRGAPHDSHRRRGRSRGHRLGPHRRRPRRAGAAASRRHRLRRRGRRRAGRRRQAGPVPRLQRADPRGREGRGPVHPLQEGRSPLRRAADAPAQPAAPRADHDRPRASAGPACRSATRT